MLFINWGEESADQKARRTQIEEQMLFEQAIRFAQTSAAQGGVGSSKKDASANSYVEKGYIDNYFE